jgi:hypothetical protein
VRGLWAFALAVVVFPIAAATHEVTNIALYSAFGYPASLEVTPWRSALFGFQVFGVHAGAGRTPSVPVHVAVDLGGPAVAAALFSVLWLAAPRGALRTALLANVLVLAFFAVLEGVFAVGENVLRLELDVLTVPEISYAGSLAIVLGTVVAAGRRPRQPARKRAIASSAAGSAPTV